MVFPMVFPNPFVPGGHPLPLHEALRGPRGTPRPAAAAALRPGGGLGGAGDDHQAWGERLGKPWENHGKMWGKAQNHGKHVGKKTRKQPILLIIFV